MNVLFVLLLISILVNIYLLRNAVRNDNINKKFVIDTIELEDFINTTASTVKPTSSSSSGSWVIMPPPVMYPTTYSSPSSSVRRRPIHKNGLTTTELFHGGCIRCKSQDIHGISRCKGCLYFKFNHSLPDLSIT